MSQSFYDSLIINAVLNTNQLTIWFFSAFKHRIIMTQWAGFILSFHMLGIQYGSNSSETQ